jgi:predicted peroxiredoxin
VTAEGERVEGVRKVGFIVRHAGDAPETATLPFILANGAMAMGAEPVVILQEEGVRLAVRDGASAVAVPDWTPLEDLFAALVDAGYRIMACGPCLAKRGIAEEDLRDGVFIGGAGMVVQAMLECENMLTY